MKVDQNAPAETMTVRLAAALQIMAGLLSNSNVSGTIKTDDAAQAALGFADSLIAAHNEENK